MELGRRIAAYRRIAGFTQEELAERLRVTPETISRFERGVIAPSFERLELMASVFHVTLRDLFDFKARPPATLIKTARDRELEALLRHLRKRSADDIARLHDVMRRVLAYGDWRAQQKRKLGR
jgi:transcriptional regulator with XRE-family HTH domain